MEDFDIKSLRTCWLKSSELIALLCEQSGIPRCPALHAQHVVPLGKHTHTTSVNTQQLLWSYPSGVGASNPHG